MSVEDVLDSTTGLEQIAEEKAREIPLLLRKANPAGKTRRFWIKLRHAQFYCPCISDIYLIKSRILESGLVLFCKYGSIHPKPQCKLYLITSRLHHYATFNAFETGTAACLCVAGDEPKDSETRPVDQIREALAFT